MAILAVRRASSESMDVVLMYCLVLRLYLFKIRRDEGEIRRPRYIRLGSGACSS